MSGVRASDSAPFCQQSPVGSSGGGVMVLAENGVDDEPFPDSSPITTGLPVIASGRVTLIVVCPNDGRLVATTESPETTIVAPDAAEATPVRPGAHIGPAQATGAAAGSGHRRRGRGRRSPRHDRASMS